MRYRVKLISLLVASAPGLTMAIDFGDWSVTEGNINRDCVAAEGCQVIASGDGFLQVEDNGHFVTIITERGAGGTSGANPDELSFYDETYVQNAPNSNENTGIAGKQRIHADGQGGFTSLVEIRTGFGLEEGTAPVVIDQDVGSSEVVDGIAFESTFDFRGDSRDNTMSVGQTLVDNTNGPFSTPFAFVQTTASGVVTGSKTDIEQEVGLQTGTIPSNDDVQGFVFRATDGSYTDAGRMTVGGTEISWTDGEKVAATWIGQLVDLGGEAGGVSAFGYVAVDVIDDSERGAFDFTFNSHDTESPEWTGWNTDAFGEHPSLPVVE